MSYKKTKHQLPNKSWVDNPDMIIRKADNAAIPKDEGNIDYLEYLDWVAEGNTPDPAD